MWWGNQGIRGGGGQFKIIGWDINDLCLKNGFLGCINKHFDNYLVWFEYLFPNEKSVLKTNVWEYFSRNTYHNKELEQEL